MYFTSDSMLPENQQPLIITVAPYGPQWLPSDYRKTSLFPGRSRRKRRWIATTPVRRCCTSTCVIQRPVTDQKIQRVQRTIARLRKAVPKMIIQVGGSISFAPGASRKRRNGWATTRGTC